jgi:hypothetical protein
VTEVLDRRVAVPAARPAVRPSEPAASVWVRGAFAATWSAALGLASLVVVALVVWSADSRSTASAGGAMRLAAQLWLLAHRTPMRVSAGTLTLPPLGLTLVLGMVVARATSIVARGSRCSVPRDLRAVVASVVFPYAVIASVVAAVTPSSTMKPSPGAAFVCAVLVGGLFATIGAARGAGLTQVLWASVPFEIRTSLKAAGSAAVVLLTAATLLTVGSMLAHLGRFATMVSAYHGAPGLLSMLLLSVLLVPNAVIFSVGYLAGPGFAIGAGTSVALGGTHLGAVPALPLLAAVPVGPAPWPVLVGSVVVIAAAGIRAGWRVSRRSRLSLARQLSGALAAAAVLGVGTAIVVGFAGGPSGPGRLSAVGPSPWQVGLAVAAEIAVVAVLVVLTGAWIRRIRGLAAAR